MIKLSCTCFRQERHWKVAEFCLSSINSMLSISQTVWLDSSLKILLPFDKSLQMDFAHDPIFSLSNFSLISFIFASSCKIASWDTPSSRRSISNSGFFSKAGSESRNMLPCTSGHIITKRLLLLRIPIAFQCDFRRGSWCWESFFRTAFDLRFERLLCRCNLLAQDCARW